MIKSNATSVIPKSYIDFKNKWLGSQEKNNNVKVRGWVKEKNQDRREIKALKKEKSKYNKTTRGQMGKKMKEIKFKIRKINRKISNKNFKSKEEK